MPSLHAVAVRLATILVPLSVALSAYLYLYPFAHRCGFPTPPTQSQRWLDSCAFQDDALNAFYKSKDAAPFRLLALGDPQLEGDTSLPEEVDWSFKGFAHLHQQIRDKRWSGVKQSLETAIQDLLAESFRKIAYVRKNLDLLGNDYYLAHIYRTLHWATDPTHTTVLGDLLGSQWIDDAEFEKRAERFWSRVFKGAEAVPQELLQDYSEEVEKEPIVQMLGEDASWRKRLLNVAGNHDIGYAGDISRQRIERFERAFGPLNGDIRFTLPTNLCNPTPWGADIPTLRLILLNSMNLDSPANDDDLQQETYKFVNAVIEHSAPVGTHTTSTILLTHVPLHKEAGICVDAPFFSYFPEHQNGGVEEQNMLSKDISVPATLQGIFGKSPDALNAPASGLGRDGIILTGHDHEGCDTYHYVEHAKQEWTASEYSSFDAVKARQNESIPGLREVTVRSMMGEFGGNAALVSAWWDGELGKWQIEVNMCELGVQHIWWAIHITDLVTVVTCIVAALTSFSSAGQQNGRVGISKRRVRKKKATESRLASSETRRELRDQPSSKKTSAFSRRMQQSLAEGQVLQDSDGDTRLSKSSPSSKRNKKKPNGRPQAGG